MDFPTPWTPLMPMKNGVEGEEAAWRACRERMKGMQWMLLSSIISAMLSIIYEGGVGVWGMRRRGGSPVLQIRGSVSINLALQLPLLKLQWYSTMLIICSRPHSSQFSYSYRGLFTKGCSWTETQLAVQYGANQCGVGTQPRLSDSALEVFGSMTLSIGISLAGSHLTTPNDYSSAM